MTWAKLINGGSLNWTEPGSTNFPSDYWAQADVWIPSRMLDNACVLGTSLQLLGFGFPLSGVAGGGIGIQDITGSGDWRWFAIRNGSTSTHYTSGPTADTTYTLQFHYHSGTVDFYVSGTLIATLTGFTSPCDSIFLGGALGETCCCVNTYTTNVKVGTTNGGTDIFSDAFSSGLDQWAIPGRSESGFVRLVASPADDPCPTLTISPRRGQPGTELTISGTGYAPDSALSLYFNLFGKNPVPIEAFAATADGSGDFTATIPSPFGLGYMIEPGWTVTVIDDLANAGCATFSTCGPRASDGINHTLTVATGGGTGGGTVLDYIFHNGFHWVLWADPSATDNPTTFPPPTNHTLNATQISADGSSVIDYPIDTNYQWIFGGGGDTLQSLDFRLCGLTHETSPAWTTKKFFNSWAKPVYDARFASDGANLWVGVVTAETIQYPFLDNRDATQTNPGSAAQFVPLATLTSGFTTFATDLAHGYLRHYTATFGGASLYQSHAFPTTDAGPQGIGVWAPPVVVMFAFDGAAFNRIGEIAALYCPDTATPIGGNAMSNANSGIGAPLQEPNLDARYSRVSMAASPAEPGICHVVWAEGGDWGRYGDGDPCTGRFTWDGGPPNRDYRVNYTTWSPTAKLTDNDLWHAHLDRSAAHFPYNTGSGVAATGYQIPSQADFTFSPSHDIRNDTGSPLLFIGWPQVFQNIATPGGGSFGPSPWAAPDGSGNPWLQNDLALSDTIHVYSLDGGVATLLQSITPDLFPNQTETEYFFSPVGNGVVAPLATDSLFDNNARYEGDVRRGFISKPFGISLIYDDPLLGGTPVYLVSAIWRQRWVQEVQPPGTNVYLAPSDAEFLVSAFHRVPADMSGPFTFLDGSREVNFTVVNATTPANTDAMGPGDFFGDPRDIWEPLANLADPTSGKQMVFDRVCGNVWEPFSDIGPTVNGPCCPGFHYDPLGDSITVVTPDHSGVYLFSVVTSFICRGCRGCPCATGVHIAHRV